MASPARPSGGDKSKEVSSADEKVSSANQSIQNPQKQPSADIVLPIRSLPGKISGEVPLTPFKMPTAGTKFETNHFTITLKGDHIYRYDCAEPVKKILPSNPDTSAKPTTHANTTATTPRVPARVRRRIFVLLRDQLVRETGTQIATNYKNQLVTRQKIPNLSDDEDIEVLYYDEDQQATDSNLKTYTVHVGKSIVINTQNVLAYLRKGAAVVGPKALFPDRTSAQAALKHTVDAMNIMFSQRANEHTVRHYEQKEPDVATLGDKRFYAHTQRALPLPRETPAVVLGREGNPEPVSLILRDAPGGLMGLIGFFRSVKNHTGSNFFLNINTVTGCFYQPCRLDNLIHQYNQNTNKTNWLEVDRFIKGLRVQTKHRYGNEHYQGRAGEGVVVREKIFTVSGVALRRTRTEKQRAELAIPPWASDVMFQMKVPSGQPDQAKSPSLATNVQKTKSVSVAEYWRRTLKIVINDKDIIVRVGNDARPEYFPARFLEVLPGQPYLNTVSMVREACRVPEVNFRHINNTSRKVFGFDDVAARFDLNIGEKLLTANATKLPQPQVMYQKPLAVQGVANWNLRNYRFAKVPDNQIKYACIQFAVAGPPMINQTDFQDFQRAFTKASDDVGLKLDCVHKNTWVTDNSQAVRNVWNIDLNNVDAHIVERALTTWKLKEATVILVLLPRASVPLYAAIKRASDFVYPSTTQQDTSIPTVCMLTEKIRRTANGRLQYLANIQLKLNVKSQYGTINHRIAAAKGTSQLPRLLGASTMLVGLDVTHPGIGAMKQAPSVAAMVSSMDPAFVRYITNWNLNPRPTPGSGQSQEEVISIADMLEWHLDSWVGQQKRHPTEIIFYRDGLSDGQFEMCRTEEIERVRKMLDDKFPPQNRPKLLVVCTVKRHNTRFLGPPNNKAACDNNRNPVASTVFYGDVTQGDGKDFFLVSHRTLQGTTRPTHYVVLWNEIPDISTEDIAQATNHLCYTWQRSTTSVGLVPPSYYADKACDRARYYLYSLYHGHASDDTVYDRNNQQHLALSSLNVGVVAKFRMSYI